MNLEQTFSHRWQTIKVRHASLWLWLQYALLASLSCLLFWKGVIPGWHSLMTDFPNYYLVARLFHQGYSLDRIYDWIWLQRIKDHWGLDQPLVGFAGLTPLSALPVLPLAAFSALTAKRLWLVASLLFLLGTAEALQRATQLGRRRIWILGLLAIIPLRTSFLLGQMHILVLFLMVLAYFFRQRKQALACGVSIGLAAALKVYPLLFLCYFIWKKQWREALSTGCSTLVLLGIGYACMGSHIMHIYLSQILPRSMQGEVLDPYSTHAASAAALLHRLFLFEPGLNAHPVWNSPLLYAIFYPLWQVALLFPLFLSIRPYFVNHDVEKIEWAAFLLTLLVLSPVPSSYHFVVMILSVVLAADVFLRRKQYGWLAIAVALYFGVCNVMLAPPPGSSGFSLHVVLASARLWIGLLLWLLLTMYLWRQKLSEDALEKSRSRFDRYALLLLAGVCFLWIAGFIGYRKHFAHNEDDLRARIELPSRLLLTTAIEPRPEGFIATAMMVQGYGIVDQNGNEVWPAIHADRQADQLSSATTADGSLTFIELADAHGSRVVLVPSTPAATPALQLPDAESPTLSSDGRLLAYIKEQKGRGSLWLAHLAFASSSATVESTAELVTTPYDVRDAAFSPSDNIVFTARVDGKTSIYQFVPGEKPAILVSDDDEVESPRFSADGKELVFRKLLHNRWQLLMMSLADHQQHQLTFGDCNAFAPVWTTPKTIAYATDCGRGLGLSALASIQVGTMKRCVSDHRCRRRIKARSCKRALIDAIAF